MTTPWFDDIGLAYAKHHDEIEAARSEFTVQRQALLDRLVKVGESAVNNKSSLPLERGKVEGGWETLWLTGKYTRAKHEAGSSGRRSGLCFGLGLDEGFASQHGGCFGFGAYVFFQMSPARFAQLRPTIVSIGAAVDYYRKEDSVCLRSAWVTPGTERFRLDVFEEEVAQLPELFAKADEAISHAYIKAKSG
jgi:hypothetical protein